MAAASATPGACARGGVGSRAGGPHQYQLSHVVVARQSTHHFAHAVAVEVELVFLEVFKVLLHLEEALQGLRCPGEQTGGRCGGRAGPACHQAAAERWGWGEAGSHRRSPCRTAAPPGRHARPPPHTTLPAEEEAVGRRQRVTAPPELLPAHLGNVTRTSPCFVHTLSRPHTCMRRCCKRKDNTAECMHKRRTCMSNRLFACSPSRVNSAAVALAMSVCQRERGGRGGKEEGEQEDGHACSTGCPQKHAWSPGPRLARAAARERAMPRQAAARCAAAVWGAYRCAPARPASPGPLTLTWPARNSALTARQLR